MTSDLKFCDVWRRPQLEAACKILAFYLNYLDQTQPVQNLVKNVAIFS